MRKLIREITVKYKLSKVNRNRAGKWVPSKNIKVGNIHVLTVANTIAEIQDDPRILMKIANKHKYNIAEVQITISDYTIGAWSAMSNDVY